VSSCGTRGYSGQSVGAGDGGAYRVFSVAKALRAALNKIRMIESKRRKLLEKWADIVARGGAKDRTAENMS